MGGALLLFNKRVMSLNVRLIYFMMINKPDKSQMVQTSATPDGHESSLWRTAPV